MFYEPPFDRFLPVRKALMKRGEMGDPARTGLTPTKCTFTARLVADAVNVVTAPPNLHEAGLKL